MTALPSGTVSLLFSDIEGSTRLLSRLGPAYAQALDGQRHVLRKAWAEHGGTEMGTEGDSFFVVFPTAVAAVAAAVQAQRELAAHPWPSGERVRVRMGIHTGSPSVHDGGYVGMDVHRAARIAGSAHGGQVVLSQTTAHLADGCLPEATSLRDLGSHQLKDIASPERLFQLAIDDLRSDFPPLKTLGAASSLPRQATPLVGRDGELAELTALLRSPEVSLVTLTGPGGSGKTRLAIAVAERLMNQFPDGVYFVPLAAVTTAEVMLTSIADALDVPPESRTRPELLNHVAHRASLLVLDNLEQIEGADGVLSDLLDHSTQMVIIATSRRPVLVLAEHVHPVPPLELPESTSLHEAQTSGAVQLFLQHARKVKPSFALTTDNVIDVTEVCRRLDGLPLAIELGAARIRLLTPKALLARLDNALDLTTGNRAVTRQKTLRDTIGWSYDLLTPNLRVVFCRLGVFAGGAELDAVSAVSLDEVSGADPFDLLADLVDASLLSIGEGPAGEPRVAMLQTIRAFALDQLTAAGELHTVQRRHAQHFVQVAESMGNLLKGDQHIQTRAHFEVEHDNYRAALRFTLRAAPSEGANADDARTGLRLCAALADFWTASGYNEEMRRWLERAIECASGQDSPDLARCLTEHAFNLNAGGDLDRARDYASASVAMWRRLDDTSGLPRALSISGEIEVERGHYAAARELHQEALAIAQKSSDDRAVMVATGELASLAVLEHHYERSVELYRQAIAIARTLADPVQVVINRHNLACTFHKMRRFEEAAEQMLAQVTAILRLHQPWMLIVFAEDFAATLAELGAHHEAVQLFGAADAMRDRVDMPRPPSQHDFIAAPLAITRDTLHPDDWDSCYQAGQTMALEDAVSQAHTPKSTPSRSEHV